MSSRNLLLAALCCGFVTFTAMISHEPQQQLRTLSASERAELLAAREKVWRAYFTNDRKHLEAVIPPETIAINFD
ncbi:MAG: hypothetical protein AAB354_06275, partial [candidate division KSB1 bacterium]